MGGLDPQTVGVFEKRRDVVSWAVAAAHVLIVLSAVYVAAAIGPSPLLLLLWVWFGVLASGLLNLMHECAHALAFRRRASSDLLGRWLLGPLGLADFDGYRERHWAHHRNLGRPDDTKDAYLVDIRGTALARFFLRCLVLSEARHKLLHQVDLDEAQSDARHRRPPWAALARIMAAQVILLSSIALVATTAHDDPTTVVAAVALAYGGVYLYGLSTLTIFTATLRAIAEHQVGEDTVLREGRATLRNFAAGPLSRLVFGSYGFALHATHHREPGVPHYRLSATTATLVREAPELTVREGYVSTLWSLARPPMVSRRPPSAGRRDPLPGCPR